MGVFTFVKSYRLVRGHLDIEKSNCLLVRANKEVLNMLSNQISIRLFRAAHAIANKQSLFL